MVAAAITRGGVSIWTLRHREGQQRSTKVSGPDSCLITVSPVEGQVEFGGLGHRLGVGQRAGHAAEDAVMNLDHLVYGFGRHVFPGMGETGGRERNQEGGEKNHDPRRGLAILTLQWTPWSLSQSPRLHQRWPLGWWSEEEGVSQGGHWVTHSFI